MLDPCHLIWGQACLLGTNQLESPLGNGVESRGQPEKDC